LIFILSHATYINYEVHMDKTYSITSCVVQVVMCCEVRPRRRLLRYEVRRGSVEEVLVCRCSAHARTNARTYTRAHAHTYAHTNPHTALFQVADGRWFSDRDTSHLSNRMGFVLFLKHPPHSALRPQSWLSVRCPSCLSSLRELVALFCRFLECEVKEMLAQPA